MSFSLNSTVPIFMYIFNKMKLLEVPACYDIDLEEQNVHGFKSIEYVLTILQNVILNCVCAYVCMFSSYIFVWFCYTYSFL